MPRLHCIWLVIWLMSIKLCNSSGKLRIRFVRFQNNRKVKNGDCCDNLWTCSDACDVFLEICVTEVSQSNCNADKFRSKVFGEGPSLTFPGIGGDLGNGRKNPLEYTFQRWQGFTLAIEIWDYDSSFLKGASDFVDNVDLDMNDTPEPNSTASSNKAKRMASNSSPSERYIDLEISIYCDDSYLLPDCARLCISRDDAQGHYTCDYVRGLVVCNQHWYGDNCTQYCRPRNDSLGHYTCDNFGTKICARDWFGSNCSRFCKNTDDLTGHYNCDSLTGNKVCLTHWYDEDCLVFCKEEDNSDGHYSCNKTSGEKVCLLDWYGARCTKYCRPQNDRLLGNFQCDVNGNKNCLPGWHGVNCTQEILQTPVKRRSTISESSHGNEAQIITRNTDRHIQSTTLSERKLTRFEEARSKTSPMPTATWNINQLKPSLTISSRSLHRTNKQATTLILSSSTKMSKQSSMHSVTSQERLKTSNHFYQNKTFNKVQLKTSSLQTQTLPRKKELSRNTVTQPTLKVESKRKTSQAVSDMITQQKTQSSLALTANFHGTTGQNSQSKSTIENSRTKAHVTETFKIRNFITPSKTQQSSQRLTNMLHHNRSIINPSTSLITETVFLEKNEASSSMGKRNKVKTSSLFSEMRLIAMTPSSSQFSLFISVTLTSSSSPVSPTRSSIMTSSSSPVSPTRSSVMTSSSSPVLSTRSSVVTSSSSAIEMDGGKVLKKKPQLPHNFVIVFFPTVALMLAIGVGICIKIKQKKQIFTKVAPVKHLQTKTNASSQVLKISHSQSQQELLQMDVLSTETK